MACTTILVGKKASYDGSTMIARNEDAIFCPKRMIVVEPDKQPKTYKSKISHLTIELPKNPMRYTANPNAEGNDGIQRMAVLKCDGNLNITGTITTNTYETTSEAGVTGNITKIKGLFVYCKGTLTNTGKITQTARGTCDTPGENIYLSLNNDDTYEYIPAEGGNGGTGSRESWWSSPNAGLASTVKRGTGGGSAGKSTHYTYGSSSLGGSGTSGTSYSGGTRRRWLCVSEVETKVEMQRQMVVLEEMDMVLLVAAEQETQVEKVELMILTEKLELEVYL